MGILRGDSEELRLVNSKGMWWRLRNFIDSLRTYWDLSPDLALRKQVNRALRGRPALSPEDWFDTFWRSSDVSQEVTTFVYTQLAQYSGIEFSKVVPSDRLNDDLHLHLICWFDWHLSLCDDVYQRFQIDISDQLLELESLLTLKDLVVFLNHQLLSVNHEV